MPLSLGGCGEGPPSILPAIPRGRGTDAPGGPGLQFVAVLGDRALTTHNLEALPAVSAPTPAPPPAPGPRPPALSSQRAGLTAAGGRRASASTW